MACVQINIMKYNPHDASKVNFVYSHILKYSNPTLLAYIFSVDFQVFGFRFKILYFNSYIVMLPLACAGGVHDRITANV